MPSRLGPSHWKHRARRGILDERRLCVRGAVPYKRVLQKVERLVPFFVIGVQHVRPSCRKYRAENIRRERARLHEKVHRKLEGADVMGKAKKRVRLVSRKRDHRERERCLHEHNKKRRKAKLLRTQRTNLTHSNAARTSKTACLSSRFSSYSIVCEAQSTLAGSLVPRE